MVEGNSFRELCGATIGSRSISAHVAVDPRSCGATGRPGPDTCAPWGRPPLLRGHLPEVAGPRRTPAPAGRPAWPSRPPASWPANPRLRGAATNTNHSFHHSLGKPPSAQSGLHLHRAQGRLPRQTPVCAGRPLFRAAAPHLANPLRGAAESQRPLVSISFRQTPVCAGRPLPG